MVAVRSTYHNHNKVAQFDSRKWILGLGISNRQSCERLTKTWAYCIHAIQGYAGAELLLWRSVEMVEILSILSVDIEMLLAALLFPLADTGVVTEEVLLESFDQSVIVLIQGAQNIVALHQLKIIHLNSIPFEQVDSMQQIPLAIVGDFRCMMIKLAERIVYLRKIQDAPENNRVLVAKECMSIYAPLANRLNIERLKWELEDHCFRYLYPAEYKHIAKLLQERRIDREHYIEKFVVWLRKSIEEGGVKAEIFGRPKHIYSIWQKMQKKHLAFNELFDVRAVRIVAENLQNCYDALRIMHSYFNYLPDEFDDYIVNPKLNGYQSIHTVILGPDNKTIEIQIRTKRMHKNAELGVAAHWKYKEDTFTNEARCDHEDHITFAAQTNDLTEEDSRFWRNTRRITQSSI